jgi:transcriptional regulator with XRE-family HTH domain
LGFGERLKEERKRLGFTQADFAARVGVSRNTQMNYEAEEREPGIGYIASIEEIGVNSGYVVTGSRDLLRHLKFAEAFQKESTERLVLEALQDINLDGFLEATRKIIAIGSPDDMRMAVLDALIENCHPLADRIQKAQEVDAVLLSNILAIMESTLMQSGRTLSAEKKATAAAMFYRSFKASGKIDHLMIEDTVSLSSSVDHIVRKTLP